MTDIHLLISQTDTDRKRLFRNLRQRKKDFRLELIIFTVIWFVSPLLTNRPNQKPLIESMSYGMALLFFGFFFSIPLVVGYFRKVHRAVIACQTTNKRVIITQVSDKVMTPAFRNDEYCLKVSDQYLQKLYFPKEYFDRFRIGDVIKIEISENGKQVIRIAKATEKAIDNLVNKASDYSTERRLPYKAILFAEEAKDKGSVLKKYFSFLIPSKHNFVSVIILDVNILVFVLMLTCGVGIYRPDVQDLVRWGGNARFLTIHQGQYWRLLTNIFVHAGVVHLLMNAIGFVFISLFVEGILGRVRFLFLYLLAGICASLTSIWWHVNTVSVGASGAIFGLYGFFLPLLIFVSKKERELNSGIIIALSIFVGYNLLMGIAGNTDNAAHIGGLVSGFVMGSLWALTVEIKERRKSLKP